MDDLPPIYDLSEADLAPHDRPSAGPARVELPPPDTKRWVVRRKAVVVAAVRSGAISLREACTRYNLSVEEFLTWQRAIDSHGVPGLRVTRIQIYRDDPPARLSKHQSVARHTS
jgi:hypothetical protein